MSRNNDIKHVAVEIAGLKTASAKVVTKTINDLAKRAPAWISKSVTEVYNIKKSEIAPADVQKGAGKKLAGFIKVKGTAVAGVQIYYKGRLLTPIHFGMTPKAPPKGKGLKCTLCQGQL